MLTNLGRVGSPILRYRTGDTVRRAQEMRCPCGSEEMALEGGILGRSDDMVVVRGVNLYPSAVEQVVRSSGGVAEFRVEIYHERSLTEMSIQIEPAPGEDPAARQSSRSGGAALCVWPARRRVLSAAGHAAAI